MSSELATSLIAGGASLVAGVITGYFAPVLKAKRERRLEVMEIQDRFRDALLRAAYDLQSRFYNILNGFLQRYYDKGEAERRYAEESTLWLVGQYFGWVEAMRREAQFLDMKSVRSARRLELALGGVSSSFSSDRKISDPLFLVFRADQRAIGEVMIDENASDRERSRCIGYTEFQRRLAEDEFNSRFAPLREDIAELARTPSPLRILRIQHALIELVDVVDPKCRRFPDRELRTRFRTGTPQGKESTTSAAGLARGA